MDDYIKHDGLALAGLVARGDVTPQELLDVAICRAETLNPTLNAITQKHYDFARRALAAPLPQGPFTGVPFLLKDIGGQLEGTVTSNASRMWRDATAEKSSTLVERYQAAGLVIFGKTATPELAIAASTESSLFGPTRNPWDLTRTTGGSSGGAAAVVAAGIVPVAAASDGGGSIRIPASCCGLFGLKPTRARTPSGPFNGEGWGSLSASHVVSRSVRDSAAMLDAISGAAPGDPYVAPPPERPFLHEVSREPGKLRVALQLAPLNGVSVDPECLAAAQSAASLLARMGHEVEAVGLPGNWGKMFEAMRVLVGANISRTVNLRARQIGREATSSDVDAVIWRIMEAIRDVPAEAYAEAVATIHQQGRLMACFHEDYDIILSPTLARPPIKLGRIRTDNPDPADYFEAQIHFTAFTQVFNMTGQPSMSVPLYQTNEGLPVGVMFSAAYGGEGLLFRLAGQLEDEAPWFDRLPGLAKKV